MTVRVSIASHAFRLSTHLFAFIYEVSLQLVLFVFGGHAGLHLGPPAVLLQVYADLASPFLPDGPELLRHAGLHLVRQHHDVLDEQLAVLELVVYRVAFLAPDGHSFALDRVDMAGLHDLAALSS